MRKIGFLFILLLISSCSKTIYYEYFNTEDKTYAILQISKNSCKYQTTGNLEHKYTETGGFLESDKDYTKTSKFTYEIDNALYSEIITQNYDIEVCANFKNQKKIIYKGQKNKDSIFRVEYSYEKFKKDKCIKDLKIPFFPPYFKKTNKVDYTKLPKDIKEAIIYKNNKKYDVDVLDRILKKEKKRKFPERYKLFDVNTNSLYYEYFDTNTKDYFLLKLNDKFKANLKILKKDETLLLIDGIYFNQKKDNHYPEFDRLRKVLPNLKYDECNTKFKRYNLLFTNDKNSISLNINESSNENCIDKVIKSYPHILMTKVDTINYNRFPKKIRKIIIGNDTGKYNEADIEDLLKKKRGE